MENFIENKIDIYNNIPKTKTYLPEILLSDCLFARIDDQMGDFNEIKMDIYYNIQKTKTYLPEILSSDCLFARIHDRWLISLKIKSIFIIIFKKLKCICLRSYCMIVCSPE